MKKKLSLTLTAMLVGVGAAVAVTTPAYAECGPAIIDIYDLNWSKYAVVHNSCGYTINASVDVPFMGDPACQNIAAWSDRTFRTSGSSWYDPRGAYIC